MTDQTRCTVSSYVSSVTVIGQSLISVMSLTMSEQTICPALLFAPRHGSKYATVQSMSAPTRYNAMRIMRRSTPAARATCKGFV
jgi:hypothetical protein